MPTRDRLTTEERELLNQIKAQSQGQEQGIAVTKETLLADGNYDLFFLYYFPDAFPAFERLNYEFIDFLENERKGVAWLPGQHGKDLACDTPILTAAGWKTMGTVQVGDEVYGPEGKPTRVIGASETFYDHPCYELTFTDGAKVVAGEDHLWRVWDTDGHDAEAWSERDVSAAKPHGAWKTYSTREMAEKKWKRERANGRIALRFRVRCDASVDTPPADLPIDPYIFGYWLGDGHSSAARITVGNEDRQYIELELARSGYEVSGYSASSGNACVVNFRMGKPFASDGFIPRIKALGVHNNKHIPEAYLVASREQRLALLAGLMDSDGSIHRVDRWKSPRVEFSVCCKQLAIDFHRLVRSLGVRATIVTNDATLNGNVVGDRYRVSWTPTFNPFRLQRKASRFAPPCSSMHSMMSITGIRRVETVSTRCIQVDHPDHVFLVGKLFTPTHNSTTLLHWIIYVMCREPQISIIYVEKNEPTAMRRAAAIMDILEHNPRLRHDFGDFKGTQWSARAFTIAQRPQISQWPTLAVYGPGGTSALGNRCNIMVVDDPVTAENSGSELERARLLEWWNMAAATCPYPLPITNERYLNKLLLDGTTFHQDDLFHRVILNKQFKHLHLRAVEDFDTGKTLSHRFSYKEPKKLEESENAADKKLLADINKGKVTDLWSFRYGTDGGTRAFFARYQNEIIGQAQKFSAAWFEPGAKDDYAPPGGYPGCKDETLSLGAWREGMTCVTGVDPAGSTKTSQTARFACVTLGFHPDEPERVYLLDLFYGQGVPLDSDNPAKQTQVNVVLDHVKRFDSRVVMEQNNVQSAFIGPLKKEAQARGMVVRVTGHYTSLEKKIDSKLGIEAMAPMMENGYFRVPYKSMGDKRKCKELVEEFIYWPLGQYDDIVMASWFSWRVIERIKRNRRVTPIAIPEKPPWMDYGWTPHFPPSWSKEKCERFMNGGSTEESEDEVCVGCN